MKHINKALVVLVVFLWSCGKNGVDPQVEEVEPRLVSVSYAGEFKKNDILNSAGSIFGPQAAALGLFLQYDVKYYKVSYKTTTLDGKEIQASGALFIPSASGSLPLVSIQHGTLLNEMDAPSYFRGYESLIGAVMTSAGFHTGMPDYVGYGDSKAYLHPYEHAAGLAGPNVDFLFAVKEYFKEESVNWNNNLLLGGYSAGGYATLATQKLIEEKYSSHFNIKASSCGAGAYNKSLLLDKFVKQTTSGEVSHNRTYIWVMQAYNSIYGLNRPMSDYFKEPFATQITQNGHMASISGSFNTLLNPVFVQSYIDGKETKLAEAFKANDLIDFKTNITTLLIHGNADLHVPYINSTSALEGMKKAGSPNVNLQTIDNGTHESVVQDFILRTFTLFSNNKN